jgi:tight adherence protein C
LTLASEFSYAVLLGGLFGAGLILVASGLPRWAAPPLSRRIAPYVRDVGDPLGLTPVMPLTVMRDWRSRLLRLMDHIGGAESVERRVSQAGWSVSAASFRARQLAWSVVGLLVGATATIAVNVAGSANAATALLAPLCAAAGVVACDVRLQRAAHARRRRIEDELPTVLEFLSLCLAAGEGLRDALRRVSEVGTGELTAELRRTVLESGTGSSLADALTSAARRLDVAPLSRATEHLVAAMERGAPLAQVLQDQAADAREESKRRLIELAGRKEIAMLLPLVFLLLPLSVLYAVFPGIVMLRLGIG